MKIDVKTLQKELEYLTVDFDNSHINDTHTHNKIWEQMIVLLIQSQQTTIDFLDSCLDLNLLQTIDCTFDAVSFYFQSPQFVQSVKRLNNRFANQLAIYMVTIVENALLDPVEDADMLQIWQKHKNISWWRERNELLSKQKGRITNQTTELRELSTRRPLIVREQIELRFLQKIQAAETLESLQNIENEIISTAAEPELKAQLVKCVEEKKRFY